MLLLRFSLKLAENFPLLLSCFRTAKALCVHGERWFLYNEEEITPKSDQTNIGPCVPNSWTEDASFQSENFDCDGFFEARPHTEH